MSCFAANLLVRVLTDSGPRPWLELLEPFSFQSDEFGLITVPAGFQFDGASIPVSAMGMIGWPGVRAACLHDYLLEQPDWRREEADTVFREALAACGVPDTVAGVMWAAVALRTSRIAHYGDEERIGA
jgi:hypothetical protein